jgi:hypothetical protein
VSTLEYVAASRTVDVLPTHAMRRLTRRDGLLPLVLALELAVGVGFGVASHAGSSDATSVPARLTLAAAPVGPAIGPLLPGTVRARLPLAASVEDAAAPVDITPVAVEQVVVAPTPYPTHAPRNPFAALVSVDAPAQPDIQAAP